jgi:hypothetical protein
MPPAILSSHFSSDWIWSATRMFCVFVLLLWPFWCIGLFLYVAWFVVAWTFSPTVWMIMFNFAKLLCWNVIQLNITENQPNTLSSMEVSQQSYVSIVCQTFRLSKVIELCTCFGAHRLLLSMWLATIFWPCIFLPTWCAGCFYSYSL